MNTDKKIGIVRIRNRRPFRQRNILISRTSQPDTISLLPQAAHELLRNLQSQILFKKTKRPVARPLIAPAMTGIDNDRSKRPRRFRSRIQKRMKSRLKIDPAQKEILLRSADRISEKET